MKIAELPMLGGLIDILIQGRARVKGFDEWLSFAVELLMVRTDKILLERGTPRAPSFFFRWDKEAGAEKRIAAKLLRKVVFEEITRGGAFPKISAGAEAILRASRAFNSVPLPQAEFVARIPGVSPEMLFVSGEEVEDAIYVDPSTGFGYLISKKPEEVAKKIEDGIKKVLIAEFL